MHESEGSKTLVLRDAVLGRVVDHEQGSFLCGLHPNPLPPWDAAEVVRRARGRLRRRRRVPVGRLRDEAFGRYLIRRWEEAVDWLDERASVPPDLRNSDGDVLLLTTDHFRIEPAAVEDVAARLAGMEGVDPTAGSDEGEGEGTALPRTSSSGPRMGSRKTGSEPSSASAGSPTTRSGCRRTRASERCVARANRGGVRRRHPPPGPRARGSDVRGRSVSVSRLHTRAARSGRGRPGDQAPTLCGLARPSAPRPRRDDRA